MTVNSPILTLPSNFTGSNATLNDTVPVYRENPYGDVDACRMLESEASVLLPKFSFILYVTSALRLLALRGWRTLCVPLVNYRGDSISKYVCPTVIIDITQEVTKFVNYKIFDA